MADFNKLQPTISAAQHVFNIVELAEAIFLQLPPQNILVNIQRVNRKFHQVVTGSRSLQQALFFQPITTDALHFVKSPTDNRGGSWRGHHDHRAHKVYQHPFLLQLFLPDPTTTTGCRPFHQQQKKLPPLKNLNQQQPVRQAAAAIDRPEASWRKQLLTQPPVSCISLRGCGGEIVIKAADDDVGVTLGQAASTLEGTSAADWTIMDWSLWKNFCQVWKQSSTVDALRVLRD